MMDIDSLRADTPGCKTKIHFNNAGASLMPSLVVDTMTSYLAMESTTGGHETADLRAKVVEVRFRLGVWAQQDLIAGNCLDARTHHLSGHFIFEVGAYFQVLSNADDEDLVELLSFVLGIEPARDHLDGFAAGGSESD